MQLRAQRMSVASYLAMEERSQVRHEYVEGEIFAMSGASRRHNLLVTNLAAQAWKAKAGSDCQIFASSMMLRIEARNCFYYPDIAACCNPEDRNDRYITAPCFVIEVLSPSTASVDRREKRLAYLTLQSLGEYVIVDQDRMRVDVYHAERGPWASQVLDEPGHVLELSCVGLRIPLQDVYAGVELPPLEIREPDFEVPDYAWR